MACGRPEGYEEDQAPWLEDHVDDQEEPSGPEPPGAPHAPIQQQLAWTGESTHAVQPPLSV